MIIRLLKIVFVAGGFMALGALITPNPESSKDKKCIDDSKTHKEIVEVEIQVPTFVYVEKKKYGVQIGSFLNKKIAQDLKERLKNSYAVSIQEKKYGSKKYLVVVAEGFSSLKEAQEAKSIIDKKESVESLIIKRI